MLLLDDPDASSRPGGVDACRLCQGAQVRVGGDALEVESQAGNVLQVRRHIQAAVDHGSQLRVGAGHRRPARFMQDVLPETSMLFVVRHGHPYILVHRRWDTSEGSPVKSITEGPVRTGQQDLEARSQRSDIGVGPPIVRSWVDAGAAAVDLVTLSRRRPTAPQRPSPRP